MLTASEQAEAPGHAPTSVQPVDLVRRLLQWAGADQAVAYGVMLRVWTLASGPVSLLLIAGYFTRELQGYYFTFQNLLALQMYVELGLGLVILQCASHEWARLRLGENSRIEGDPEALSRLVSLGRFAFKWYAVAGCVLAVGLGLSGFLFLSRSPQIGIRWVAPWFVLCVLSGVDLCGLPLWSLLQGCNQVAQIYGFQLVQAALRSLSLWIAIASGADLWTAPIAVFVSLAWAGLFLYSRYRRFFQTFLLPPPGKRISWRTEILPFQWRIAGTWLSGYLCFFLFTPAMFRFRGPAAAGQMGMTWALVGALAGIPATWVNAKAPRFGMLVAKKDYAALDQLVWRTGAAAFGVACVGAAVIEAAVYALNAFHFRLAARLLPPFPTGLFLLATVLMQVSSPQSAYLRAHKREPFLGLSLLSGLLIGLSTVVLGRSYGATGMGAGYLAVVALVVLPVGTLIWYRHRAAWHAPIPGERLTSEVRKMNSGGCAARNVPSLSVVIPNYNHGQYITQALEAILTQSVRPREVIVVDDGSTDNSVEVIEECGQRDPIVRLLRNEKNKGGIFSANRGLEHASGDFVLFAGADDRVLPGLFERSAGVLAQYPQAGVCSAVALYSDERGGKPRLVPPRPWISKKPCFLSPDRVLSGWRRYGSLFASNTVFYRRDALLKSGAFPEEVRSAADCFALMNLALSHGACFIPEILGIYRITDSSYSSQFHKHEVALELLKRGEELIQTTYARGLPKHYVDEWTKRVRYSIALTAHSRLCVQRRECLTSLEHALPKVKATDRLGFGVLRFATTVEHECVRLYLFARLRHLSWPLVRRTLESFHKDRAAAEYPKSPVVLGKQEEAGY